MTTDDTWIDEQFVAIAGYDGIYQISNRGRVKGRKGEILKQWTTYHGYKRIGLWKNGARKSFAVHRLVGAVFIPNPHDKPHINHINAVTDDNNVENLEWCTRSENQQHCRRIGRGPNQRGARNGNAKLSEEDVIYIRKHLPNKSLSELARKFKVSVTTISYIRDGKSWDGKREERFKRELKRAELRGAEEVLILVGRTPMHSDAYASLKAEADKYMSKLRSELSKDQEGED